MAAISPDLLSEGTGWHGEQHITDLCQSFVQTSETTTNPPESTRDFNQVKSNYSDPGWSSSTYHNEQ